MKSKNGYEAFSKFNPRMTIIPFTERSIGEHLSEFPFNTFKSPAILNYPFPPETTQIVEPSPRIYFKGFDLTSVVRASKLSSSPASLVFHGKIPICQIIEGITSEILEEIASSPIDLSLSLSLSFPSTPRRTTIPFENRTGSIVIEHPTSVSRWKIHRMSRISAHEKITFDTVDVQFARLQWKTRIFELRYRYTDKERKKNRQTWNMKRTVTTVVYLSFVFFRARRWKEKKKNFRTVRKLCKLLNWWKINRRECRSTKRTEHSKGDDLLIERPVVSVEKSCWKRALQLRVFLLGTDQKSRIKAAI